MGVPEKSSVTHKFAIHQHNAIADMKNFDPDTQLFPPLIAGPFDSLTEAQAVYNTYFKQHPSTIIVFLGEGDAYETPLGEAKIHGQQRQPWYNGSSPDYKHHPKSSK